MSHPRTLAIAAAAALAIGCSTASAQWVSHVAYYGGPVSVSVASPVQHVSYYAPAPVSYAAPTVVYRPAAPVVHAVARPVYAPVPVIRTRYRPFWGTSVTRVRYGYAPVGWTY